MKGGDGEVEKEHPIRYRNPILSVRTGRYSGTTVVQGLGDKTPWPLGASSLLSPPHALTRHPHVPQLQASRLTTQLSLCARAFRTLGYTLAPWCRLPLLNRAPLARLLQSNFNGAINSSHGHHRVETLEGSLQGDHRRMRTTARKSPPRRTWRRASLRGSLASTAEARGRRSSSPCESCLRLTREDPDVFSRTHLPRRVGSGGATPQSACPRRRATCVSRSWARIRSSLCCTSCTARMDACSSSASDQRALL